MGQSPFEIVLGRQPFTPNTIALGYTRTSPPAYKFARDWQENQNLVRAHLSRAIKRMKKFADKKRRPVKYQVGD